VYKIPPVHQYKRKNVSPNPSSLAITENGPLRVAVTLTHTISEKSHLKQTIYLDAVSEYLSFDTFVSWHENRKFLKVEFPLNVRNDVATYSIQYGNLQRPTHNNTSWDMAKFEVVGQHWADLSEYGFGVSLLSSSKYGFACHENVLRLSLLRSPKLPDEDADMGDHHFTYALFPHTGSHAEANLPRYGYNFNQPLIPHLSDSVVSPVSLFKVTNENIKIEAVKRPEGPLENDVYDKGAQGIILRLWETLGGRGVANLTSQLPIKSVTRCNMLEEPLESDTLLWSSDGVNVPFTPYQIITLKLDLFS